MTFTGILANVMKLPLSADAVRLGRHQNDGIAPGHAVGGGNHQGAIVQVSVDAFQVAPYIIKDEQ